MYVYPSAKRFATGAGRLFLSVGRRLLDSDDKLSKNSFCDSVDPPKTIRLFSGIFLPPRALSSMECQISFFGPSLPFLRCNPVGRVGVETPGVEYREVAAAAMTSAVAWAAERLGMCFRMERAREGWAVQQKNRRSQAIALSHARVFSTPKDLGSGALTSPSRQVPLLRRYCDKLLMNQIRHIKELNKRELEAGVAPEASWHRDYADTA